MNSTLAFSFRSASVLALLISLAPAAGCGGGLDAPLDSTKQPLANDALQEGEDCPAEKCAGQGVGCAYPAGQSSTPPPPADVPTDIHCVADPQQGSGVGACYLVNHLDCYGSPVAPAPALKEGDPCPAAMCANDGIGCADAADGAAQNPTNVRCVADVQAGSGIGACHLDFDCAP